MRFGQALLISIFILLIGGLVLLMQKATPKDMTEDPITNSPTSTNMLALTSSAFTANGLIPEQYTCDGAGINPPLQISNVPEGTKSLVLLMSDPDIPDSVKQSRNIEKFDHWVVFNMPATTTMIGEDATPSGMQGLNGAGKAAYAGPCPPDREHRYFFRLYALSQMLEFKKDPTLDEVVASMGSTTLETAELIGRYDRKR